VSFLLNDSQAGYHMCMNVEEIIEADNSHFRLFVRMKNVSTMYRCIDDPSVC